MTGDLGYSLSPAIRRVASRFRLIGWISFWMQVISGVIATLLFASALLGIQSMNESAAAGGGLFLASFGLIAVYVGAFWAFRYTRFSRRMQTTNPDLRPRPKDATKIINNGLIISLIGMGLALLGAGAISGTLLIKVISQPQQNVVIGQGALRRFVEPLDVFIVQASINTLMAHFAAIVSSLLLARTVNRQ